MKNLRRLACKFDLDQSEPKSSQVNANTRKPWPNGVASSPSFHFASTTPFVQGLIPLNWRDQKLLACSKTWRLSCNILAYKWLLE